MIAVLLAVAGLMVAVWAFVSIARASRPFGRSTRIGGAR